MPRCPPRGSAVGPSEHEETKSKQARRPQTEATEACEGMCAHKARVLHLALVEGPLPCSRDPMKQSQSQRGLPTITPTHTKPHHHKPTNTPTHTHPESALTTCVHACSHSRPHCTLLPTLFKNREQQQQNFDAAPDMFRGFSCETQCQSWQTPKRKQHKTMYTWIGAETRLRESTKHEGQPQMP